MILKLPSQKAQVRSSQRDSPRNSPSSISQVTTFTLQRKSLFCFKLSDKLNHGKYEETPSKEKDKRKVWKHEQPTDVISMLENGAEVPKLTKEKVGQQRWKLRVRPRLRICKEWYQNGNNLLSLNRKIFFVVVGFCFLFFSKFIIIFWLNTTFLYAIPKD